MPEHYSEHQTGDEQSALDERLSTYYGLTLPDQPLPASSWEHLSSQLSPRRTTRRWLRPTWRFAQHRGNDELPFDIQQRLTHVAYLANMRNVAPRIRSTFTSSIDVPFVSVSPFNKRAIRLILPTQAGLTLSEAELDVLLASGFARYRLIHRASYIMSQLLLFMILLLPLLAVILIPLAWRNISTSIALLLLASLCIVSTISFSATEYGVRQSKQTLWLCDGLVVNKHVEVCTH